VTEERKPFWTSLLGLLTASAGMITAIGGLIAVLIQAGVIGGGDSAASNGGSTPPPATTIVGRSWAQQANDICARTNDAIDALPDAQALTPEAAPAMMKEALKMNQRMVRDLSALDQPADDRPQIRLFLTLAADINGTTEELLANVSTGNVAELQKNFDSLSRLGEEFDDAAVDLGATTCAEGASFTGGLPAIS
jgi:hypothetical protein